MAQPKSGDKCPHCGSTDTTYTPAKPPYSVTTQPAGGKPETTTCKYLAKLTCNNLHCGHIEEFTN